MAQNNPNNENTNVYRYHRRYKNINNNNFPNYNIDRSNTLTLFNRLRTIKWIIPFHDINNRFSIRAMRDNIYKNLDNIGRATDKEILKNLPETQIEDKSKLDPEKIIGWYV